MKRVNRKTMEVVSGKEEEEAKAHQDTHDDVLRAAARYKELGSEIDRLTERREEQKQIVLDGLAELESDSLTDAELKVTRVQSVRRELDEVSLKKNLGAQVWAKVTRRVLDKNLLDAKIKDGTVDPVIAAKAVIETPNKPSIRVTLK